MDNNDLGKVTATATSAEMRALIKKILEWLKSLKGIKLLGRQSKICNG